MYKVLVYKEIYLDILLVFTIRDLTMSRAANTDFVIGRLVQPIGCGTRVQWGGISAGFAIRLLGH